MGQNFGELGKPIPGESRAARHFHYHFPKLAVGD
jgi:hypothetical protein